MRLFNLLFCVLIFASSASIAKAGETSEEMAKNCRLTLKYSDDKFKNLEPNLFRQVSSCVTFIQTASDANLYSRLRMAATIKDLESLNGSSNALDPSQLLIAKAAIQLVENSSNWCVPEGTNIVNSQIIRIWLKYMDAHPEEGHFGPAYTLQFAMVPVFSCIPK